VIYRSNVTQQYVGSTWWGWRITAYISTCHTSCRPSRKWCGFLSKHVGTKTYNVSITLGQGERPWQGWTSLQHPRFCSWGLFPHMIKQLCIISTHTHICNVRDSSCNAVWSNFSARILERQLYLFCNVFLHSTCICVSTYWFALNVLWKL
jgi:hypothetical protein